MSAEDIKARIEIIARRIVKTGSFQEWQIQGELLEFGIELLKSERDDFARKNGHASSTEKT